MTGEVGDFKSSTLSTTESYLDVTMPPQPVTMVTEANLSHGVLIPAAIIFTIECIIGVVGNVFVIVAVTLSKRLQTITNVFVVELACADIFSALLIPIQISAILGALEDFPIACSVTGAIALISNFWSMLLLILIAFNRYFLITQPIGRYQSVFIKFNIVLMIVFPIAYSAILIILFIITGWASFGSNSMCLLLKSNSLNIIVCVNAVCMVILMGFFYLKIFLYVRKNAMTIREANNEIGAQTNTSDSQDAESESARNGRPNEVVGQRMSLETKITQNMLIIVICFSVCNIPAFLTYMPGLQLSPTVVWYFYVTFCLHYCLNPLIYAWKHPVFRQVFGCMLSRDLRAVEQPSRWLRERIASG